MTNGTGGQAGALRPLRGSAGEAKEGRDLDVDEGGQGPESRPSGPRVALLESENLLATNECTLLTGIELSTFMNSRLWMLHEPGRREPSIAISGEDSSHHRRETLVAAPPLRSVDLRYYATD